MIPLKLLDENGTTFGVERIENRLSVSSTDKFIDIAEGDLAGHHAVSKFGFVDAANATHEEVWTAETAYTYITTPATLYLSSSAAGDDQPYEIQGLDGKWNEQTVQVTAAGFSPITLPGTWTRIFRMKNMGITDNAGIIYVGIDADPGGDGVPDAITDIKGEIAVGRNQTLMAFWAVPRNHTAYVTNFYASCAHATAKVGEVALWVRPYGGVFQTKKIISINNGQTAQIRYDFPLKVEAKSDIRVTAKAASDLTISAGFDLWHEE